MLAKRIFDFEIDTNCLLSVRLVCLFSQARFGRLLVESRAAYIKEGRGDESAVADARVDRRRMRSRYCDWWHGEFLKDQLVAALRCRCCAEEVCLTRRRTNGIDGLQQAVDATLGDVCGKAQLRADVGELEKVRSVCRFLWFPQLCVVCRAVCKCWLCSTCFIFICSLRS